MTLDPISRLPLYFRDRKTIAQTQLRGGIPPASNGRGPCPPRRFVLCAAPVPPPSSRRAMPRTRPAQPSPESAASVARSTPPEQRDVAVQGDHRHRAGASRRGHARRVAARRRRDRRGFLAHPPRGQRTHLHPAGPRAAGVGGKPAQPAAGGGHGRGRVPGRLPVHGHGRLQVAGGCLLAAGPAGVPGRRRAGPFARHRGGPDHRPGRRSTAARRLPQHLVPDRARAASATRTCAGATRCTARAI